jgi:hypothetical protein
VIRGLLPFVATIGILRVAPAAHAETGRGWWLTPVEQLLVRLSATREAARPYSTPVHPRDLVGGVALSCEHQQGQPCGDGLGAYTTMDSSAGYGDLLSARVRLRAGAGSSGLADEVVLDRVALHARLGPFALAVGRDVLVLGPASRTQLGWGDHAPPLDQVRVALLPRTLGRPDLRGALLYVLGRLRGPQTYPGTLMSIARGELAVRGRFAFGMMQMLQLGGEGAPSIGVIDFVLEHVRRRDMSASPTDSSNRRIAFDLSWVLPEMETRFYYQLVFEDWRKRFHDAARYDADHLVGFEVAALRTRGVVVELQQTGVRSQEHSPRTTGFTNAGRVVGSPLGPDARALFIAGRLATPRVTVFPWVELARLSSDTYELISFGPILHRTRGPREWRYRVGLRAAVPIARGLWCEAGAHLELVDQYAFDRAQRRVNAATSLAVVWRP